MLNVCTDLVCGAKNKHLRVKGPVGMPTKIKHYLQVVKTEVMTSRGHALVEEYECTAHSSLVQSCHIPVAKFHFDPSSMQVLVTENSKSFSHFITDVLAIIGYLYLAKITYRGYLMLMTNYTMNVHQQLIGLLHIVETIALIESGRKKYELMKNDTRRHSTSCVKICTFGVLFAVTFRMSNVGLLQYVQLRKHFLTRRAKGEIIVLIEGKAESTV